MNLTPNIFELDEDFVHRSVAYLLDGLQFPGRKFRFEKGIGHRFEDTERDGDDDLVS